MAVSLKLNNILSWCSLQYQFGLMNTRRGEFVVFVFAFELRNNETTLSRHKNSIQVCANYIGTDSLPTTSQGFVNLLKQLKQSSGGLTKVVNFHHKQLKCNVLLKTHQTKTTLWN